MHLKSRAGRLFPMEKAVNDAISLLIREGWAQRVDLFHLDLHLNTTKVEY